MKRLWRKWRDASTKTRCLCWLALLAALIPLTLLASGTPVRDPEGQFRQWEEASFLGPTEILATIDTGDHNAPKAILAADESSVITYSYGGSYAWLNQTDRTGPFSLLSPVDFYFSRWESAEELTLPVVLFDRHPKAVRAELELTLEIQEEDGAVFRCHRMEAVRDRSGYFRFDLQFDASPRSEAEGSAMQLLWACLYDTGFIRSDRTFPATARFYDASGGLIAEESITLGGQADA